MSKFRRTALVCFVLLALFAPDVRADEKRKSIPAPNDWIDQLKKYSEIYSSIKNNYPEEFNVEKLFFASINGLLKTLDPHSYFLDPVMVRSLNEDQQGNYYGIGTRITKYGDRLTIIAPLAGTPAARLGIMAGDVIVEIEGKLSARLSLDAAMKLLRGAKGTYVSIKIKREGIKELLPFKIKRAEIPLKTISYALTLPDNPGIGFISLRTFGNTTILEFKEHLDRLLRENQIKALILDLRSNSGGSLYAAIDLADFFLKKEKVIVSVRGRTFNQNFKAKKNNQYEDLPLAVLINRGSASASEIVASALQDHQRAVIIGSRSWGKGLVQTISRLSLNSSVALTTAKYYTPNNKCLQRDFQQRDEYYYFLNQKDYDSDTTMVGGVMPDIYLRPQNYSQLLVRFISRGSFFEFGRHLVMENPTIDDSFTVNDEIIEQFKQFVDKQKVSYSAGEIEKNIDRIRIEIEREVMSSRFSQDEGIKVFLKADTVAQKAVEVLKKKYN